MARPERFELPTARFVVRRLVVNLLFLKESREGARCVLSPTMHNSASLKHANIPHQLGNTWA